MTLIADGFLAGSLLTLLLPVALLIALVWWYLAFLRRVPETGEKAAAAANPGPGAAPVSAADSLPAAEPATAENSGPGGAPASAPNPAPTETGRTPGEI